MLTRQVSRAIKKLVEIKEITKLGYGVYAKRFKSRFSSEPYLKVSFLPIIREALGRLNVKWKPSRAELEYNKGNSTQIPINPETILNLAFAVN